MATNPLVADVSPLVASLQQLTPQAQEDRAMRLAGLGQAQELGAEQLRSLQMANQKNQMLNMAQDARAAFIEDRTDLDLVLKDGPDGLRNSIARLVAEKGQDHEDIPELVEFANKAIEDPQATFEELTANRENIMARLTQTDEILSRLTGSTTGFQKTGSFIVKNPDGTTGIATGVFDPQTGKLTTETTTFGSDQLVSRLGQTAEEQAAMKVDTEVKKEVNKLKAQFKLKPAVEAAVTTAVENAKSAVESSAEGKSNAVALSMYDTAMNGLTEALGGTTTGPVAGWLPAVTTNQQVAEGAIAAMAPILKQLFRGAGEGTFTDKDQQLLVEMLPTRKDTPEARVIKVRNIDAIVRAKLNAQEAQQAAPIVDEPQDAAVDQEVTAQDLSTMSLEDLIKLKAQKAK